MKHKITTISCSTNSLLHQPAELKLYCMVRLELVSHSSSTLTSQPVSVLTLCTEPTNCCRVREMSHQIFCSNLKQIFCWSANYSKIIPKQTPKNHIKKRSVLKIKSFPPHPHLTADNSTKEVTSINFRLVNNKVSSISATVTPKHSLSRAIVGTGSVHSLFPTPGTAITNPAGGHLSFLGKILGDGSFCWAQPTVC